MKRLRVVGRLRIAEQRLQHDAAADDAERGAVLRRGVVEVDGRNEAAGARHIAHDHAGIAGEVLAEMAREQPRGRVIGAAGGEADDDGDLLALVEIRGACRSAGERERRQHCRRDSLHHGISPQVGRNRSPGCAGEGAAGCPSTAPGSNPPERAVGRTMPTVPSLLFDAMMCLSGARLAHRTGRGHAAR